MAKEGVGYVPDSKNNKKNDKTKQPPLKQMFVKEERILLRRRRTMGRVAVSRRAMPLLPINPAILTLLMCYAVLVMGMFMPNLLVLLMSTLNGLFGFLRPLLLTSKDPVQNGYLKPSIDLL